MHHNFPLKTRMVKAGDIEINVFMLEDEYISPSVRPEYRYVLMLISSGIE